MTRFVPVWGSKVLVMDGATPRPILLRPDESEELRQQAESIILLGETKERAYFAVALTGSDDLMLPPRARTGEFRHLRSIAPLLEQQEAGLLAYAKAMTYWHISATDSAETAAAPRRAARVDTCGCARTTSAVNTTFLEPIRRLSSE